MRLLTVLEQQQTTGAAITGFSYDFTEPDEAAQMSLHIHLTGDQTDILNIIKQFSTSTDELSGS